MGAMRTSQVAVTMRRLERRILAASASEPDQTLTLTQGVSVLSASSESAKQEGSVFMPHGQLSWVMEQAVCRACAVSILGGLQDPRGPSAEPV